MIGWATHRSPIRSASFSVGYRRRVSMDLTRLRFKPTIPELGRVSRLHAKSLPKSAAPTSAFHH